MNALVSVEARMGNDIARQFGYLPQEEAVAAIAAHIGSFWDPRMKRALAALVATGDDPLDQLLVGRSRTPLTPADVLDRVE